jgi:hypothetical protein
VARKNSLERPKPRKNPREEPGYVGRPVLFWLCRVEIITWPRCSNIHKLPAWSNNNKAEQSKSSASSKYNRGCARAWLIFLCCDTGKVLCPDMNCEVWAHALIFSLQYLGLQYFFILKHLKVNVNITNIIFSLYTCKLYNVLFTTF